MSALDRHARIALSFSGGKDSLACIYLLAPRLDRITVYHCDPGDLLPETEAVVRHVEQLCPRFVRIRTDVTAWIADHGLPSDLLPYSAHQVGRAIGQGVALSGRYECCLQNIMAPLYYRIKEDGNTLLIRGTKTSDMPKMPVLSGQTLEGIEFYYPIQDWNDDDVLAYLRAVGAPVSRAYEHVKNSLDCARCSAWWSEGRGAYLRRYHPDISDEYQTRLRTIAHEVSGSIAALSRELGAD